MLANIHNALSSRFLQIQAGMIASRPTAVSLSCIWGEETLQADLQVLLKWAGLHAGRYNFGTSPRAHLRREERSMC